MFRPMSLSRMATPALLMAAIIGCPAGAVGLQPLTSAFTYQGELGSAGAPASGTYDIRFRLYDAVTGGVQIGGTVCSDNLAVEAGRFSVSLDFGAVFTGQKRFLEIEVRADTGLGCADDSGYTVLSPRQELTTVPNAVFAQTAAVAGTASSAFAAITATTAENALMLNGQPASFYSNAANLVGTVPGAAIPSNVARLDGNQAFTGAVAFTSPGNAFVGSGAGLTNLQGANLLAGSVARTTLTSELRNALGVYTTDWRTTPYVNTANVPTGSGPIRIATAGGFAYVVSGLSNTLQVFSLVDGANPVLVSSVGTASSPRGVAVSGRYVYVTCQVANRLQIFDLINPLAPALLSTTQTDRAPVSVAVSGNLVFVANFAGGSVQVFNVSDPSAPVAAGIIGLSGGNPTSVVASGSTGFVVTQGLGEFGNRLVAVSASIPGSLTILGSTSAGPGPASIALSGTTAYVVNLAPPKALQVFDVSDPSAPAVVGSFVTLQDMGAVSVAPPYAFVANLSTSSVDVYDITSATSPVRLGSVASPEIGELSATGSHVYVLSYDNSRIRAFSGGVTGVTYSVPLLGNLIGNASTASDATNLGGRSAAFYTDAGSLSTGVLDNARTTGSAASAPNTLVLRDGSGNFSAGTITATLNGNASSATTAASAGSASTALTATNATNASQLNGQAAAFYTNAGNLSAGTLPDARLSGNVPRLNANNAFSSTANSFAGRVGVNTPAGALELDVNGRINVASGVIQKDLSAGVVTATTDLGLYSQIAGGWVRFVTNNAQFAWFSDSGAGTTPRMVLSPTGNLTVSGSLAKAGGSFKIDHPLDPENKYLYHSFVESPDMMNIYNGNVTTDGQGLATVTLPEYFEALNRDFRYQLTVVDGESFAMVRVSRKISGNTFQIASSVPGVEVSWQVTGIRKDAWAEKNRIPNTVEKPAGEKGTLLHPEAFGRPATTPSRGGAAEAGPVGR